MNATLGCRISEAEARQIVQRAVERGLCSQPVFLPHRSDREILTMRRRMAGLTAHGTAPVIRMKADGNAVPKRIRAALEIFLKKHEAKFTVDDFHNFLVRSKIKKLSRRSVSSYLSAATRLDKPILKLIFRGGGQRGPLQKSQYQGIDFKPMEVAN